MTTTEKLWVGLGAGALAVLLLMLRGDEDESPAPVRPTPAPPPTPPTIPTPVSESGDIPDSAYHWGTGSKDAFAGVAPRLVAVMHRALEISPIDMAGLHGLLELLHAEVRALRVSRADPVESGLVHGSALAHRRPLPPGQQVGFTPFVNAGSWSRSASRPMP